MKPRLLISVLIAALLIGRAGYSQEMHDEEYRVYETVIRDKFLTRPGHIDLKNMDSKGEVEHLLPKTIVILEQTFKSFMMESLDPKVIEKELPKDLKALSSEPIKSWKKNNAESHPISDRFSFEEKVLLLSRKQFSDSFKPKSWASFYERYPNALGYFALSRVGFDEKKTVALVYIANMQDRKWGSGSFYFLVKEEGKWKIKAESRVWVS
jgi:hypothetical protein